MSKRRDRRAQRKPFDRREGESEEHFALFEAWLDSRDRYGRRSTGVVAKGARLHPATVRKIARKHDWKTRGVETDRYVNSRIAANVRRAIRNLTRRHIDTIESAFSLTAAMERRLVEMLACDVVDKVEEDQVFDAGGDPVLDADGMPVYRHVAYTAAKWSYDSAVKMLRTITEMRENALLLTLDLEGGRVTDRCSRRDDDPVRDDPAFIAAYAEAMRRAEANFMAARGRKTPPSDPKNFLD